MAKKSEINKKGRLAKSTLSVVLAASMVLTSSSFVWATPVEDIAVVEEGETTVEAVEAPVEEAVGTSTDEGVEIKETDNAEEVVGAQTLNPNIIIVGATTYTGAALEPDIVVFDDAGDVIDKKNYTLNYSNNINASNNAKVTVKFRGEYQGSPSYTETFTIDPMELHLGNTEVTYNELLGFLYNGQKQTPSVKSVVTYSGTKQITLQPNDYELVTADDTVYDLKSAGQQKVILNSTNSNYEFAAGLGEQEYTIQKAPFNAANITLATNKTIPHGESVNNIANYITVKNSKSGEEVDITTDAYGLSVFQSDGSTPAAGTFVANTSYVIKASIPAAGTANYTEGSVNITVTAGKTTLATLAEGATVSIDNVAGIAKDSKTGTYKTMYNGKDQYVTSVAVPGLTQGVDYSIDSIATAKGKDVGTFTVNLTGQGLHDGESATLTVQITPKEILAGNTGLAGSGKIFTYEAELGKVFDGAKPGVESDKATLKLSWVVNGETVELEEGKDYSYTTDKGQGKVIITGMGNYTTQDSHNSAIKTLKLDYDTVDLCNLNDPSVTGKVTGTFEYTGSPVTPGEENITIMAGAYKLVMNTDFTVGYENNTAAGDKARVVIQGIGRFTGTIKLPFTIIGSKMADIFSIKKIDNVLVDKTGNSSKPNTGLVKVIYTVTTADAPAGVYSDVKFFRGGVEVAKYTVGDANVTFIDATAFQKTGTITVEVNGAGKYEGSKLTTTYQIVGKDIADVAKVDAIANQAYTGSAVEPSVKVTHKTTGVVLTKGKDYNVTYRDNIESGTAYAIITGAGEYGGEILKSFKIVGQMDQNFEFLAAQVRDIKKRTLASKATTVKYDVAPKTDVTYTSSDEKVFTVDAKTGAIAYTGVGTATLTATAAATDKYKAETKTMTVKVVPVTPANVKVTSTAKRKITVKAGEVKEAAKYQIRIQKNGRSSVYVNVDNVGDLSKVYTTKSSGKFNVWVRAYKTIGDKDHHFSAWSAKKTVTVK